MDITVAITAHGEGSGAGPALQSVQAAMTAARAAGYTVECIASLDTPTPDTAGFFARFPLDGLTCHTFDFADQGLSRNALARLAKGRYIAFLDADDMFSENWLLNAAREADAATAAGERPIVHPELNWQFGKLFNVYSNPTSDDPFFSFNVLATANYYDAMCLAPTQAYIDHPFPKRDIASGFAMEDYQWFVEMSGRGWAHKVASDTIIFKRRRAGSQSVKARENFAKIRPIAPLAIDALKTFGQTDL